MSLLNYDHDYVSYLERQVKKERRVTMFWLFITVIHLSGMAVATYKWNARMNHCNQQLMELKR